MLDERHILLNEVGDLLRGALLVQTLHMNDSVHVRRALALMLNDACKRIATPEDATKRGGVTTKFILARVCGAPCVTSRTERAHTNA